MPLPPWLNENRLLTGVQIMLTLGGSTLFVWLFKKWLSLPAAPLAAIAVVAGALILYGTLQLPQPKPRRRLRGATPPVPAILTPRGQVNSLITEAQTIRRYLPTQPDTSDITAALVGSMTSHTHLWQIAGWHARTWQTIQRVAPASTALYDHVAIPANNYDAMRTYLDARLAELRDVMRTLP